MGLYLDLMDNTENTVVNPDGTEEDGESCDEDDANHCTVVADDVVGFTNAQMYSCLTASTESVADFRNCLIANHLANTPNTLEQVEALFDSY